MTPTATTGATPSTLAGRREWLGLAVLTLPTVLLALDASVLFLALPQLAEDLSPTSSQLLWIMDVYGFLIAGLLVTMGTLGDRIGRRRLLLVGAAVFGVTSVAAAFAPTAEMLVVSRAVLGAAGATLMPSTLALISNTFRDARQRSLAVGIWMASFTGGFLVGPVIGGALLEAFWWGSVFLIGVPVMVLLLVAGPFLLPEYRDANAGRLDLVSAGLSLVALLSVIYGLKRLAADGPSTVPVLAIAVGVAVGAVFVRRQRRLADPMLDLRLFSNRAFGAVLAITLLGMGAMVGTEFFVAQYLQLVEELSPLRAGLWMMPAVVAATVATITAPVLARRVRPATIVALGFAVAAIGFVLLTQIGGASGFALAIAGMMLAYFGVSPAMVLGADLVLGSAPPEKAGAASSLSETSGELGVALGVAAFGSLGTVVYRDQLDALLPAGVPTGAADAARESLAGATAAAERLPATIADELLAAARAAFVHGLTTAAAMGGVIALALAVVAAVVLRHLRPSGESPGSAEDAHAARTDEQSDDDQDDAPDQLLAQDREDPADHEECGDNDQDGGDHRGLPCVVDRCRPQLPAGQTGQTS